MSRSSQNQQPDRPEGTPLLGMRDGSTDGAGPSGGTWGVCLVDPQTGGIVAADQRLSAWLSAVKGSLGGRRIEDLGAEFGRKLAQIPLDGSFPAAFDAKIASPDETFTAQISVNRLRGERDILLVEISRGFTAAMQQWPVDAVTGLADRRALASHRADWARSPSPLPHAVLFLDLDGFKRVNDQYGHAVGDQVLAELAERWRRCVREGDLVARYGGDEFVMLVGNVKRQREVDPIVHRLQDATRQPFDVGEKSVEISVTIGVALATDCSKDLRELIAAADREMYAAKARGRV